ncbi:Ff.00g119000.m01.CDS01 [Fusarium sp. VM40]|nr:Ff.00g119000.m01.CDS01 [Fusarium sp. VM40]
MVRFPTFDGQPYFYPWVSQELHMFHCLASHPPAIAAVDELWEGWYSRQPLDCSMEPNMDHVYSIMRLCAYEPDKWPYNQPNPNKTTWSEVSHIARYCIRMCVVLRGVLPVIYSISWDSCVPIFMWHAMLNVKAHSSRALIHRRDEQRSRISASRESGGSN